MADAVLDAVKANAAAKLSTEVCGVNVISDERVDWNDSSCGVRKEGMMSMMMITPGRRIKVGSGSNVLCFHTGRNEKQIVECPDGAACTTIKGGRLAAGGGGGGAAAGPTDSKGNAVM